MTAVIPSSSKPSSSELRRVRAGQRRFAVIVCAYYAMANAAGVTAYLSAWYARQLPFAARYAPLLSTEDDGRIVDDTQFAVAYVYQVAGMLMLSALNITMELFPSYLMHLLAARFDVIGARLQRLGWRNEVHGGGGGGGGGDGGDNGGAVGPVARSSQLQRRRFVECLCAHQNVLRSVTALERSFSRGMFAQICLSGTVICVYAFLLTFTSPLADPVLYAFYVTFLGSMITQIFVPCYFGNELQLASARLTHRAYTSNWTEMGGRFARVLCVFVERTQRRTEVVVGKMFPLSLQTFTSIISFAYKLYAVLAK